MLPYYDLVYQNSKWKGSRIVSVNHQDSDVFRKEGRIIDGYWFQPAPEMHSEKIAENLSKWNSQRNLGTISSSLAVKGFWE